VWSETRCTLSLTIYLAVGDLLLDAVVKSKGVDVARGMVDNIGTLIPNFNCLTELEGIFSLYTKGIGGEISYPKSRVLDPTDKSEQPLQGAWRESRKRKPVRYLGVKIHGDTNFEAFWEEQLM
jgi:hypothetical protein